MDNYVIVGNFKRRKLGHSDKDLTNIFEDKIIEDVLKEKYFYCANKHCYKIKETGRLFCCDHSLYNTTLLKKSPIKIHEAFIKDQINLDLDINTDIYLTKNTF